MLTPIETIFKINDLANEKRSNNTLTPKEWEVYMSAIYYLREADKRVYYGGEEKWGQKND